MAWPFRQKAAANEPKAEQREWLGQWWASPLAGLGSFGRSYQEVDPVTGENSLQAVAFRSACDLLASLVSEMHFDVYSGSGVDRRKRTTPGYLLDPAGDGYGVEDWIYALLMSYYLRGNVYGRILDQGPTGMLRQVDLWHPDRVGVHLEDGLPKWTANGTEVPRQQVFHRRANTIPGTLLGLSPVAAHADTLGLSIATTRFGRSWFQDGGHPGGLLTNSEADMSDDKVARTAKDRFLAALFGTREPVVLGRGWKYEQIQVAPEESQFLQTQGYSAAESARILGAGVAEVLGYDTGSSMTYSTMVDRDLSMLKYSVDRWLKRVERILSAFLSRPQYVLFDRESFLDTNVIQRWQVNKVKLDSGAYVINEVRAQNADQPVPWGNEPFKLAPPAATEPPTDPDDDDPANPPTGGTQ